MRSPFVTGALLVVGSAVARAQPIGLQMSCMGGNAPQVIWGMVINNGRDPITTIAPQAAGSVIDEAECLCNSTDLFLQGLVTQGLPQGSLPPFSVWEGSTCNAVTARSTTGNTCEQITADVGPMNFWVGASSARPQQRIVVRSLIAPIGASSPSNPLPHTCVQTTISNAVWLLFGDPNAPDFCEVTLPARTLTPTAPINVTTGSGDGAVTVEWDPPPVGTSLTPVSYQVLCADENGAPLPGQGAFDMTDFIRNTNTNLHPLRYSTCTAGGIERQLLAIGGDTVTHLTDGGVVTAFGEPVGANAPGAGEHGTRRALAAEVTSTTPTVGPFTSLDKSFVCSDPLQPVGLHFSLRIGGLENGHLYQFAVVGIDGQGNTAPSAVVTQTPQPVEDLYRRFVDQGGRPQGFCYIATAAWGSYQSPYVRVLRDFRDRELLPHRWGRAFVGWYYRTSPPLAEYVAAHAVARLLVRQALWPVIGGAALWLWLAGWQKLLLVAAAVALGWRRRRRRAALAAVERAA